MDGMTRDATHPFSKREKMMGHIFVIISFQTNLAVQVLDVGLNTFSLSIMVYEYKVKTREINLFPLMGRMSFDLNLAGEGGGRKRKDSIMFWLRRISKCFYFFSLSFTFEC